MEIQDWKSFPKTLRGGVLCVGNFDGVHLGHAKMLATGRQEASRRGSAFTIMTFDPHPSLILKPGVPRLPLTTLQQRRRLLESFSPDVLLIVPATREFLSMSADTFLQDVVQGSIGAKMLVEGPTFTFGRGAKGTVETLKEVGGTYGFETLIVPAVEQSLMDLTLVGVSSSVIRWLIEQGRVSDAERCLGRPYALEGTIIEGEKRGGTIGFPTANLQTEQLIPMPGVYAGRAKIAGPRGGEYRAAISIGDNPTFAARHSTVEAYLLDFSGDLYGQTMELEFHRWVREMFAYSGVGPLVDQMKRDVEWTRQVVSQ